MPQCRANQRGIWATHCSTPVRLLHGRKSQLPVSASLFLGHCGKLPYRSSIQASRLGPVVRVKPIGSPVS